MSSSFSKSVFSGRCTACPRLASYLATARRDHVGYHARPVAPFGDPHARLLIVGLAPGMHGANRTGRPFTGDHAGILLYHTLHKHGFASRPVSVSIDDGLTLNNCRITNAVKCVPPENKPLPAEIKQCNGYLRAELKHLADDSVVLALGRVAHQSVLQALDLRLAAYPFAHAALHRLPNGWQLLDSYHCSRYNTQTRRLTTPMFDAVVRKAAKLVG